MAGSEENWPQWPAGAKTQRMVDVSVACKPDELFQLLFSPQSAYVSKSQDQLGNKDYTESIWTAEAELAAGKKGDPSKPGLKPAEYKGLCRKTTCSGSGMGLKYINTELQRCTAASDGGPFEVDVVVHTTATYGDRFRPILKHRVVGAGPAACTYTVDYTLVYITNTNSFLKKAIERGATNGVTKNFEILVEILGGFKTVKSAEEAAEQPAKTSKGEDLGEPKEARTPAFTLPWWSPRLSKEGVQLMELPATWLIGKAGARAKKNPLGQASPLAVMLAAGLLLIILASLLFLLQASHTSCKVSSGLAAGVCRYLLSTSDVPASLRQVLTSGALLVVANAALSAISSRVLDSMHKRAGHNQRGRASSLDGGDPCAGIRYEGFEQSLESAAANISEGEGKLKKGGSSSATPPIGQGVRRERFKENLKSGLKSLIEPMRSKQTSKASLSDAAGPSSPPATASPPPPQSAFASTTAPGAEAVERSKPSAGAETRPQLQTATSDESSSAIFSDEDEARSQAGIASKRSSGAGFREYMNPGTLLDKTETMFAQWSGAHKHQKSTPAQNIPQIRGKSVETEFEAQAEASHNSSSAMEMADLSPRDPEEILGDPVEEEVFENERYQPFRGWGHQWPGHFLPTDRVGHWSTATGQQIPSTDSASFDAVAPRLKKGWEWIEEGWQIEVKGLLENAVDEEGWTYAVDFGWIHWPPAPGNGRFRKVRDYVRRRRWFRTRRFAGRPLQESPAGRQLGYPAPTGASFPTNAISGVHGLASRADEAAKPQTGQQSDSLARAQLEEARPPLQSTESSRATGSTIQPTSGASVGQERQENQVSEEKAQPAPRDASSFIAKQELKPGSLSRRKGTTKEGSKRGFADKMSNMLSSASHTLRPNSAKGQATVRLMESSGQPVLVRESAPVPEAEKETAARTGSENLDRGSSTSDQIPDLASYFGIGTPGTTGVSAADPSLSSEAGESDSHLSRENQPTKTIQDAFSPAATALATPRAVDTAKSPGPQHGNDQRGFIAKETANPPATALNVRSRDHPAGSPSSSAAKEVADPSTVRLGVLPLPADESDFESVRQTRDAQQDSSRALKPTPFARGELAELAGHSYEVGEPGGEGLSNRRLAASMPSGSKGGRESSDENLPRAMSADEASQVIQEAREAVEQVQRELHAMLPFMEIPDRRNGRRH